MNPIDTNFPKDNKEPLNPWLPEVAAANDLVKTYNGDSRDKTAPTGTAAAAQKLSDALTGAGSDPKLTNEQKKKLYEYSKELLQEMSAQLGAAAYQQFNVGDPKNGKIDTQAEYDTVAKAAAKVFQELQGLQGKDKANEEATHFAAQTLSHMNNPPQGLSSLSSGTPQYPSQILGKLDEAVNKGRPNSIASTMNPADSVPVLEKAIGTALGLDSQALKDKQVPLEGVYKLGAKDRSTASDTFLRTVNGTNTTTPRAFDFSPPPTEVDKPGKKPAGETPTGEKKENKKAHLGTATNWTELLLGNKQAREHLGLKKGSLNAQTALKALKESETGQKLNWKLQGDANGDGLYVEDPAKIGKNKGKVDVDFFDHTKPVTLINKQGEKMTFWPGKG